MWEQYMQAYECIVSRKNAGCEHVRTVSATSWLVSW
jgi:hypothetical protein